MSSRTRKRSRAAMCSSGTSSTLCSSNSSIVCLEVGKVGRDETTEVQEKVQGRASISDLHLVMKEMKLPRRAASNTIVSVVIAFALGALVSFLVLNSPPSALVLPPQTCTPVVVPLVADIRREAPPPPPVEVAEPPALRSIDSPIVSTTTPQEDSRSCEATRAVRQGEFVSVAHVRGCPPGDDVWLRMAQLAMPDAKVFLDIGCNKGFTAARFFR
jgi:hypothetical protein